MASMKDGVASTWVCSRSATSIIILAVDMVSNVANCCGEETIEVATRNRENEEISPSRWYDPAMGGRLPRLQPALHLWP